MSDLHCAATAVLLDIERGEAEAARHVAALLAQRVAAVVAVPGRQVDGETWARRLELPLRLLDGEAGLLPELLELADEFRGESVLVLVGRGELAALGAGENAVGAQLALDADGARLSPWPAAAG